MRQTFLICFVILIVAGMVFAQDPVLTLEKALIDASEKVSPAIVSIDMDISPAQIIMSEQQARYQ